MKQMLSLKRLLLLLFVAASMQNAHAQVKISTAYTNSPNFLYGFATTAPPDGYWAPQYITFTVSNTNCYPIVITDVDFLHFVDSLINFGSFTVKFNNNGATYTLLKEPSLNGVNFPSSNITSWNVAGSSSSPIYATTTGVQPVITGLNVVIPPMPAGTYQRFALLSTDTMVIRGGPAPLVPTPATYTTNGVTLRTIDANAPTQSQIWLGVYPSAFTSLSLTGAGIGMDGAITFRRQGPTVSILNNNPCDSSGDTVTLVATIPSCVTGGTVNWTGPNGTSHVGSTWKVPAILAVYAGQYSATYSVPGPPAEVSAPTTVTVNITAKPAAPAITGKTQYCIGEPFQPLTVTGNNILWYTTPTGGTGTTLAPYVNTNAAGSYTWYASQSTANGCEGYRTGITITVAPIPKAPTVTSPVSYCEGDPAVALSAGATGALTWYVDPSGGLGSVIAPVPGTSVQDTLTWYVSQTVDGCEGPRSRLDVIVTFKPNGMIVVSDTNWICARTELTFQYYGSGVPSTGYNWTLPPGAVITNGTTGPGPLTIRFDSAGTQQLIMQANNLGCYSDKFIQNVKVKPLPTGRIYAPNDVCLNATSLIQIQDYTPTIDTFNWQWDGGIPTHFATDQGPYGVYWTTPGKHAITVDLVDDLCHTLISDTLTVRQLPDAKITAYLFNDKEQRFDPFDFKGKICASDSLRFEPNTIVTSSKYEWTPSRFFEDNDKIPVTYGRVDFEGNVKLKVTDELGCVNSDSVKVLTQPCCTLTFPNAFTPNGDGHNDNFSAITAGFHTTRTFRILNRWGQTVYENTDEHHGWDGTFRGEPADMGTYYYYINFKCDGRFVEQRGEFLLVR